MSSKARSLHPSCLSQHPLLRVKLNATPQSHPMMRQAKQSRPPPNLHEPVAVRNWFPYCIITCINLMHLPWVDMSAKHRESPSPASLDCVPVCTTSCQLTSAAGWTCVHQCWASTLDFCLTTLKITPEKCNLFYQVCSKCITDVHVCQISQAVEPSDLPATNAKLAQRPPALSPA